MWLCLYFGLVLVTVMFVFWVGFGGGYVCILD